MMMALFKRTLLDWKAVQAEMIRETSDYINECFRNPELAVRIPAVRAEEANWSREFAEAFWRSVL
ncbi:MAG: hypothetical protein JXQ73_28275 [Phycisphaerae bacterium]|nr:hypothetical protein [Phycisphaerae bacterium]